MTRRTTRPRRRARPASVSGRAGRAGRAGKAGELEARVDAVERGTLRRGFAASREAMAAMVVVRAIERATRLAGEEGGRSLLRALREAKRPLEAYIQAQLSRTRRRRKA